MGFMPRQTVSIASGQLASPEFTQTERWASLGVLAPTSLAEYVTLQAAETTSGGGGTFRTLQSGGIDIALTAARGVEVLTPPFPAYRFAATSAVAIGRDFFVFPRK